MIKYNHDYAKPDKDGYPLFCPMPLRYTVQHHEEWDEDVIDPETGEPTGEKEHHERDWTEEVVVAIPSKSDAAKAGYLPLYDNDPGPHEDGRHWERTGKIENADAYYFWEYTLVDDPPPPPRKFSVKSVAGKIKELGYTAQVREALMSANAYEMFVGANYLREDDEDFLAMRGLVQQVTGLTEEQIEAVLSECIWEEG